MSKKKYLPQGETEPLSPATGSAGMETKTMDLEFEVTIPKQTIDF